jgi:type IV secretory pathway ATPase VirB11/archaellum biosynthesis ATPase
MNGDNSNDLTKLERLAALMRDDGIETEAMDAERIARYIQSHKIEMSGPQKRFEALLKKAKARRRLQQASERRLKAVEKANSVLSAGTFASEAVSEKVRAMIESLRQHDPEQAQVYARDFEKATPEDLAVLEEDLTLLEMENSEDEPGDPQNPR